MQLGMRQNYCCLLEYNVQSVSIPRHALMFDDTGMGKTLDQINLPHQLHNVILLQALESNTYDSNRLSCMQNESTIDGAELPTSDAVPQLLFQNVSHDQTKYK